MVRVAPRWPLVGRIEECSIIDSLLQRDGSAGVVLAGLAGVGKTRLLQETLEAAQAVGMQTVYVVATRSAAAIPFGVFAALLDDLPTGRRAERFEVLHDLLTALRARAEQRPLVVAVDDAHLLDDSSSALVGQLVGQPGIAVLLTVRTGEASPDGVTALWKDGYLNRIELQSLAPAEVDSLIDAALPGAVAPDTKAELRARSGGNALMLREVIEDAIHTGRLAQSSGAWVWSTVTGPGARLIDIIESRLGRLSDAELQLAELVAVGEPIHLATLKTLLPDARVAECERSGLVSVVEDGDVVRVRLSHPLYGEVIRSRLPLVEHDRLCRLLADELEARGAEATADILRLATWRLACHEAGHADVYRRGALAANGLFDHALAERLARQSLVVEPNFDASVTLGEALTGQGRYVEADDVLAAIECADDARLVRVVDARVKCCAWGLGDFARAESVVTDAAALATGSDAQHYLTAERAGLLIAAGRAHDALELAVPVFHDPASDDVARLRMLGKVTAGWALTGRSADAIAAAEASLAPALRLHAELPNAVGWVMAGLMDGRFAAGDLAQVGALLDGAAAMATLNRSMRGYLFALRGRHALVLGHPRTALELLVVATSELRAIASVQLPYALALLAHAEAMVGNAEAARVAFDAGTEAKRAGAMTAVLVDDVRIASAWVTAAEGNLSAAGQIAAEAGDDAQRSGRHLFEVIARHEAVRLGRTDQLVRLEILTELVDGLWPAACFLHARALADDDGAGLDSACGLFESIGAALLAAECATEAGRAHERVALKTRATASAAKAQRLVQECEGARTPALQLASAAVRLSRREREVAALAADGRANKEIAERLSINVRTVEGHLYQAFAKLGVTDRAELSDALGRLR